jgi:hypothetical protein
MRLQAKTANETEAQTAVVDMAEAQVVVTGRRNVNKGYG